MHSFEDPNDHFRIASVKVTIKNELEDAQNPSRKHCLSFSQVLSSVSVGYVLFFGGFPIKYPAGPGFVAQTFNFFRRIGILLEIIDAGANESPLWETPYSF